jgi:hypothetical protein
MESFHFMPEISKVAPIVDDWKSRPQRCMQHGVEASTRATCEQRFSTIASVGHSALP